MEKSRDRREHGMGSVRTTEGTMPVRTGARRSAMSYKRSDFGATARTSMKRSTVRVSRDLSYVIIQSIVE